MKYETFLKVLEGAINASMADIMGHSTKEQISATSRGEKKKKKNTYLN